jgi:pimeloyl-ACP methyl ester carboxylesterase
MRLEDCERMADTYSPLLDAEVQLSDGRALGYAIWGDPEGEAVLLLHGSPSSRLFAPDPAVTAACGVRLVTIDRPGYGRSDSFNGRQILDWPADVAQLADALGLHRFVVAAHSSGGPYALACALAMPERVTAVVLASCVVPLDELAPDVAGLTDQEQRLVRVARTDPVSAAAMIADAAAWLLEEPDRFLSLPRPEPDARLLEHPPVRQMFATAVREAVRRGLDGYVSDEVLERRPWGYRLADVVLPVSIWHGAQDGYIPQTHAETMASLLPNSRLRLRSEQGHGLLLACWNDILRELAAPSRRPSGASATPARRSS